MKPLALGHLSVAAVVERAGPTRPTWLLPDATPEAVERHRAWLAPHFVDDRGRFLQSIHAFVVRAPGLTVLIDTCVGNDKDRGLPLRSPRVGALVGRALRGHAAHHGRQRGAGAGGRPRPARRGGPSRDDAGWRFQVDTPYRKTDAA